jgi:tetratricopeptide (TPR) repeat protein
MSVQAILERVLQAVDRDAYLTPVDHVDRRFHEPLAVVARALADPDTDPATVRAIARGLHAEGRLDAVHLHSALHVIAASPRVADYAEAARQVAEQETAALRAGGASLDANLASVDRHRGVLAFLQGHYEVALDYFARALERQRTPENVGNLLCALVRLGELDEATDLLDHLRGALPHAFVRALDARIDDDPDLAPLRNQERDA